MNDPLSIQNENEKESAVINIHTFWKYMVSSNDEIYKFWIRRHLNVNSRGYLKQSRQPQFRCGPSLGGALRRMILFDTHVLFSNLASNKNWKLHIKQKSNCYAILLYIFTKNLLLNFNFPSYNWPHSNFRKKMWKVEKS